MRLNIFRMNHRNLRLRWLCCSDRLHIGRSSLQLRGAYTDIVQLTDHTPKVRILSQWCRDDSSHKVYNHLFQEQERPQSILKTTVSTNLTKIR